MERKMIRIPEASRLTGISPAYLRYLASLPDCEWAVCKTNQTNRSFLIIASKFCEKFGIEPSKIDREEVRDEYSNDER